MENKLRVGMETKTTRVTIVDSDSFLRAEFPSRSAAENYCQIVNDWDELQASRDSLLEACKQSLLSLGEIHLQIERIKGKHKMALKWVEQTFEDIETAIAAAEKEVG